MKRNQPWPSRPFLPLSCQMRSKCSYRPQILSWRHSSSQHKSKTQSLKCRLLNWEFRLKMLCHKIQGPTSSISLLRWQNKSRAFLKKKENCRRLLIRLMRRIKLCAISLARSSFKHCRVVQVLSLEPNLRTTNSTSKTMRLSTEC